MAAVSGAKPVPVKIEPGEQAIVVKAQTPAGGKRPAAGHELVPVKKPKAEPGQSTALVRQCKEDKCQTVVDSKDPGSGFCAAHNPNRKKPCATEGCMKRAIMGSTHCYAHCTDVALKGKICTSPGCLSLAVNLTVGLCTKHGGAKKCTYEGCDVTAIAGFKFCRAHGGGKFCKVSGCQTMVKGRVEFCHRHQQKTECKNEGCTRVAATMAGLCVACSRGGMRLCDFAGCDKLARGSDPPRCAKHGGGARCTVLNCPNPGAGATGFCISHGGGRRCAKKDCFKPAHRNKFCTLHDNSSCCVKGCRLKATSANGYCKEHAF